MRLQLTIVFILLSIFSAVAQNNANTFFTWNDFVDDFGKELVSAESVYKSMVAGGHKENAYVKMDFTFVSDKKDNLTRLSAFIKTSYPYTIHSIVKNDGVWELNGITNDIPMTLDNLMYWGVDMYKRGYEFDSRLDAYGGEIDPKNPQFPQLDSSKGNYYFDEAVASYEKGNLSGAIVNFTLAIQVDSSNAYSYYSRAVIKAELYTWKNALRDYDKAIELNPDYVDAYVNRGALKDDNGDYRGAINDYNKVLSMPDIDLPNKQMVYYNRGNSKYNLNNKKGACEDWKKSLELGFSDAQERLNKYCN